LFEANSRGCHAIVTWPCQITPSETNDLNRAMILNNSSPSFAAARRASEDLRLAPGQHELAALVRNEIPSPMGRGVDSESPERLLALLTYSYAAGVYDTAEIPHELDQNDLVGLLGGGVRFDHQILRRFRRQNRDELRDCLSRVLRRARETPTHTYAERSSSRWSGGGNDGCDEEAEERINRAIRADSFALDD
jgi:hypothetical protein